MKYYSSYQPDSTSLVRAEPKEKPPLKSIYQTPQKFSNKTPPAPKYNPPKVTISLERVPHPAKSQEDGPNRDDVITPTNVTFLHRASNLPINRKRRHPSLVQNPRRAPIDSPNFLYNPTKDPDAFKHPKPGNYEMSTMTPMFRRPKDSELNRYVNYDVCINGF